MHRCNLNPDAPCRQTWPRAILLTKRRDYGSTITTVFHCFFFQRKLSEFLAAIESTGQRQRVVSSAELSYSVSLALLELVGTAVRSEQLQNTRSTKCPT